MSTDITPGCYSSDSAGCDCTMTTLGDNYDATVYSDKVGDEFQLFGLRGINGATVALNVVDQVIDIDGGGGGNVSLQAAYDGGNTISVAGALPVDIATAVGVHQSLLNVHDSGPTGLFSINSTGLTNGDAVVQLNNTSGLRFNSPIDKTAAPVVADPFTRAYVAAPPSSTNTTSTVTSVANVGAISAANAVYSFTIPATSVSMIDLSVVARTAAPAGSLAGKILIKADPSSGTQALVINTQIGTDAALAGATLDAAVVAGAVLVSIVGGPIANYVARDFAVVTTYDY